jgi:uncharacterized protein DUF5666
MELTTMRLRTSIGLALLALFLTLTACGGSSPTEPTPAGGPAPAPPATSGATIAGQISTGTAGSAAREGIATTRATPVTSVSVVGTTLTAAADSTGRFTLSGVPAGAATLRFTGPGTDATVAVGEVRAGDTVTLTVAVNGGAAAILDDSRHPSGAPTPINGVVRNLTGTVDAFEFTIDGRRIRGDRVTEFYGHPNMTPARVFEEMNNTRAEVKAWPRDGFWYAERLHVNVDEEVPETPTGPTTPNDDSASIEGLLTAMSGARPSLTLTIAGTVVRTSGSTVVQRRGDVQDLSVLQIGMTIHVVGDRRGDGSIDARRLQIKDDATGAEFEIEGSVGGLKGSCPAVTFGVNGFNVATTSATTFTPACGDLKNGNKVKVRGVVQGDGSVRATSVTRQ